MKAVLFTAFDTPPAFVEAGAGPAPGAGQAVVRLQASSVNPIDGAIAAGMLKEMAEHAFPITLGRDLAGIVEAVSAGVVSVAPGDAVFGVVPCFPLREGAWAERVVVDTATIVRTPRGVDTATAGAVGLAAVTAVQCLDALDLGAGQIVLVVGATGGVGTLAVQLAGAIGATVIAPGLPEDVGYLRELGVHEILSRDGDIVAAVREGHPDGVDAVLDLVNHAPGSYDAALAPGGRVASPTNAAGEGPGRTNVMAVPTSEVLARIAGHLADDTLRVHIQRTYGLAEAPAAIQALATGHTRGKIAIRAERSARS